MLLWQRPFFPWRSRGEGDAPNVGVLNDGLAHFGTKAVNQVEHALGETDALMMTARWLAVKGVISEGLATMVLPINKAGATFHDSK